MINQMKLVKLIGSSVSGGKAGVVETAHFPCRFYGGFFKGVGEAIELSTNCFTHFFRTAEEAEEKANRSILSANKQREELRLKPVPY